MSKKGFTEHYGKIGHQLLPIDIAICLEDIVAKLGYLKNIDTQLLARRRLSLNEDILHRRRAVGASQRLNSNIEYTCCN